MLGHQLVKSLGTDHDVYSTYRQSEAEYDSILRIKSAKSHFNLAIRSFSSVETVIRDV